MSLGDLGYIGVLTEELVVTIMKTMHPRKRSSGVQGVQGWRGAALACASEAPLYSSESDEWLKQVLNKRLPGITQRSPLASFAEG